METQQSKEYPNYKDSSILIRQVVHITGVVTNKELYNANDEVFKSKDQLSQCHPSGNDDARREVSLYEMLIQQWHLP